MPLHPHRLASLVLAAAACSSSSSPAIDVSAPGDAHAPPDPDASPLRDGSPSDSSAPPDASTPLDAFAPPDATHPHDATSDSTIPTPDAHDAATDAPLANPVTLLGACLGTASALTVSGQMPYVDVPVGSEAGEFVLDFGSTFSSIDLSAFPAPGPTTSGCNESQLGAVCTVDDFAFFSAPSSVTLTTEDFSGVGGAVRQAGIIGTDFLSETIITLDYAGGEAYAGSRVMPCPLASDGWVSLTTAGFYENDVSLLEPFTNVDTNAAPGEAVPNVPTVTVRVAGTNAKAQLDTGFDDSVTPFSVNINVAFFNAIHNGAPASLVRDASLDETLTTCVNGVSEPVTAYRLATGISFDFVSDGSAPWHSYPNAVLFVKNTPAAAASCGGIGTWSAPAAQVGASFYVDMKAIVFDPFAAKVWLPAP